MTKEQFVEAEHPRDGLGKFRKLSTKELKEALKIDYGKFVKTGETTVVTPELMNDVYKGSDKYPKTTRHYEFIKSVKNGVVEINLDTEIQKRFDKATPRERTDIARKFILDNFGGQYGNCRYLCFVG